MIGNVEYEGFNITLDGRFSMYDIHRIGQGKLPESLAGTFTNTRSAMIAIDSYLATKGKKNADTSSGSGG